MPPTSISLINLFAVASGGALGSVLRYAISVGVPRYIPSGFPYATLFVNAVGSFAMGIVAVVCLVKTQTIEPVRVFLMAGLLGGFTTFSAFSLDAFRLFDEGEILASAGYVGASVCIAILALVLGMVLGRALV